MEKTLLDCYNFYKSLNSASKWTLADIIEELKKCREGINSRQSYAYDGFPHNRTHLPSCVFNWLCDNYITGEIKTYDDLFEYILENREIRYTQSGYKDLLTGTFNKEIAGQLAKELDTVIKFCEEKLDAIKRQEAAEKADYEAHKNDWKQIKVYKKIMPRGGENGTDGYIDADYENAATGEVIRYVCRDVFDFGIYGYPKHAEGENVLEYEETANEMALSQWLRKYGEFAGCKIRM